MRRRTWIPTVLACAALAACSSSGSGGSTPTPSATAPTSSAATPPVAAATTPTTAATTPTTSPSSTKARPKPHHRTPAAPTTSSTARATSAAPAGAEALPLDLRTHGAKQVITVVAPSSSSTTATLQAWHSTTGGWRRVGPSVPANLGSNGVGQTSESQSRTPAGSFTLTQAFGHDSNPGTALPYLHTTPADWWISTPGSKYNTHQRCSTCGYGDPDEHLYYETPFYNYAVVIDYNTANAPGGVQQGAGSAFFLHVSVGEPTAGCVSIDQGQLVRILRWLDPSEHPRILIGVG